MRFHTLSFILLLVLACLFALLNWPAFTTPTELSLGVTSVYAPIGVIMLVLLLVLGALSIAQVIYVQGAALFDARRQAKELQAQRDVAERAEASRLHELQGAVDREMRAIERNAGEFKQAMLARFDQLEATNRLALQETANSLAAQIGQLEDRWDRDHAAAQAGTPPLVGGHR